MRRKYALKLDSVYVPSRWKVLVVMSLLPPNELPKTINKPFVAHEGELVADLRQLELKLKNQHWYNRRPKYYQADFTLQIFVGTWNLLKFQIMSENGSIIPVENPYIPMMWGVPVEKQQDAN